MTTPPPLPKDRALVVTAKPLPAALEFRPDAIELEERPPPRLARITLYAVVLFIGCAVTWASVSTVDEIVVAPGRLITERPLLVVQPLEKAVIREIAARPGELVRAGQVLARLDPTFPEADVEQLRSKIGMLQAQVDRLEAELAGAVYEPSAAPTHDEMMQVRLAQQRAAYYGSMLRDFDTRIARSRAALGAASQEETVLARRLEGLQEIDRMRQASFDKGTGTRLDLLLARDVSFDVEAGIKRLSGSRAEAEQALAQAMAEKQSFIEDYRRLSLEALVERRDSLAVAGEELKKAELRNAMAVMTAPADAAVLDVAQRSIGSVVQEAEPLFTLVPLDVPLEAEVSVAASDIGRIVTGDPARVKFDAFPFQKHGTASGNVRTISQDAFTPAEGAKNPAATPFYKVNISLADLHLRDLPTSSRFLPGMTVQAELNVGRRSVISYFLYPLLRGLDESLHEP